MTGKQYFSGDPMSIDTIISPCIGVCTEGENGLCMGCMRTMDEITNWLNLAAEQRERIMCELPARLEALFN